MSASGRRNLPGGSSASGGPGGFCPPVASAWSGPLAPRGEAAVFFVFSRFGKFTTTGRDACSTGYRGCILSAVGQGTPPNSLRDLWRTSDLKGEVVSAQDRLCPSLAARRSPASSALGGPRAPFVRR